MTLPQSVMLLVFDLLLLKGMPQPTRNNHKTSAEERASGQLEVYGAGEIVGMNVNSSSSCRNKPIIGEPHDSTIVSRIISDTKTRRMRHST